MGSTASINYAASRKYKQPEIEVKFNKMVKYDDGDEKPFRDEFQMATKKQPLSLLATAIRILEKKPKEQSLPNGYHKPTRPRSAYVVYNKPTHSSSTLNSSLQSVSVSNSTTPKSSQQKQLKTKQNLYMSLIHPNSTRNPKYGMTVPSRIRIQTPMDYQVQSRQPKANTLPRYSAATGKRIRVNHKLYMDMIRPVMTSPQFTKLNPRRSIPPPQLTNRTISRQSHQTRFIPRPPNNDQILRQLDPNSGPSHHKQRATHRRDEYRSQREVYTPLRRPPTTQRHGQNGYTPNSSMGNGSLPDIHRFTRKTKDDVSLNSSINSRSQIPQDHPDNIKPLYFRKSLAYSPQYKGKDLLTSPLRSMNS